MAVDIDESCGGEGRPHATHLGVALGLFEDGPVGGQRPVDEGVRTERRLDGVLERFDGDACRDIARRVTAHAVCDSDEHRRCESDVLVDLSDLPGVR